MIKLKGDLIANDNMWNKLMIRAYGENFLNIKETEVQNLITDQASDFINTFDKVCQKYSAKKVANLRFKKGLSQKLKVLAKVVKQYSAKCNKA